MITGIGVFYPDGSPTQRVGIVPDLVVHPTVESIRAGWDEVLERAASHALGGGRGSSSRLPAPSASAPATVDGAGRRDR